MKSKKVAVVDKSRCVACGACVKECPKQAISVYKGCYAKVNSEICVGCGKCAAACPTGSAETMKREGE